MMTILGKYLLLELWGCDSKKLTDADFVKKILVEAACKIKATIVEIVFHKFSPIGVAGVIVIAESHLAIHTWPEYGYAAVDLFTCGRLLDPKIAVKFLAKELECKNYRTKQVQRGIPPKNISEFEYTNIHPT